MGLYTFGQPHGGIIQTAYVVADIHDAMEKWRTRLNVGPWFLLDHFTGEEATYRGGSAVADIAIAMGFAGHMQIELLQPNDDHPIMDETRLVEADPGFEALRHLTDEKLDQLAQMGVLTMEEYRAERRHRLRLPPKPMLKYGDILVPIK